MKRIAATILAVLAAQVCACALSMAQPAGAAKQPPAKFDIVGETARSAKPDRTLVYKTAGGMSLELHIFEPADKNGSAPRSCFVSYHGGGWSKRAPSGMYAFCKWAASRGMVAISVQYRLYTPNGSVSVFDCVKDARSAMRYVRSHANELGIDPNRIVSNGASAGGHLAAAVAMFDGVDDTGDDLHISCAPNAMILYSPVIDTSAEGYGNANIGARWKELSPAHRVVPGLPPALTLHGTADRITPYKGAVKFHEAMLKAGNKSELVSVAGGVHTYMFNTWEHYEDALRRSGAFLEALGFIETK